MNNMSNFRELHDFLDYWDKKPGTFEMPKSSGMPLFPAFVTYEPERRNATAHTKVRVCVIAGPGDGKVSIEETKQLGPENYHLDFSPDYQTYLYNNSTHALVITGKSPKMGADRVTIGPIGNPN